ncbi:MAG TPA: GNAT family N-acetyltransferase, partial [Caulobacteraceae bacterium]|nr:GNAT family N-acetyltransferase [Caulobacteraceae bacterium]
SGAAARSAAQADREDQMAEIRPYRASDLDALYHVCLATGDSGADASDLYQDPRLVGHVYAAPYGVLSPESALVLEDAQGVGGYIVGVADTSAFDARLEADWWPKLRQTYSNPTGRYGDLSMDERMRRLINRPRPTPRQVVEPFPAHLHIDMLPRFQGRGFGKALIDRWLGLIQSMGAHGVHLGVGRANTRAVRFYRAYGFEQLELADYPGALWFTTRLPRST